VKKRLPSSSRLRRDKGGWRPAAGGWRPAAGGWRPAAGCWRPAAGGWRLAWSIRPVLMNQVL